MEKNRVRKTLPITTLAVPGKRPGVALGPALPIAAKFRLPNECVVLLRCLRTLLPHAPRPRGTGYSPHAARPMARRFALLAGPNRTRSRSSCLAVAFHRPRTCVPITTSCCGRGGAGLGQARAGQPRDQGRVATQCPAGMVVNQAPAPGWRQGRQRRALAKVKVAAIHVANRLSPRLPSAVGGPAPTVATRARLRSKCAAPSSTILSTFGRVVGTQPAGFILMRTGVAVTVVTSTHSEGPSATWLTDGQFFSCMRTA